MRKLAGILVLLASGSVAAAQAVTTTGQDARAAIAYWTTGYAGAGLGDVGCAAPAVPDMPKDVYELRRVDFAIGRWQDCHRRVIGALGPAQVGKAIPEGVLAAMTPDERAQALRHVASVHERLAAALQAQAAPVIARHDAWRSLSRRLAEQVATEAAERNAYRSDREESKITVSRR